MSEPFVRSYKVVCSFTWSEALANEQTTEPILKAVASAEHLCRKNNIAAVEGPDKIFITRA